MTTNRVHRAPLLLLAAGLTLACAGGPPPPTPPSGSVFATPEQAIETLGGFLASGDEAAARALFGDEGSAILSSGDEVADRADLARVRRLIADEVRFEESDGDRRIALLGEEGWPLPIPLERTLGGWRFDLAAGRAEIANRRIGRNELSTLASLHAIVEAQREYRAEGRDGRKPAYASRILSRPGRRDGLYWPAKEGEGRSPLGELVARAEAEGYQTRPDGERIPYHGYYFAILDSQGENAPGGARSYRDDDGLLTGGFAVLAWPANHGSSGIMSFLVNHRGLVFQSDLGSDTAARATALTSFDPGPGWEPTAD